MPVVHFPVHESGGLAWVWLGGAEAPPFPDLPFGDDDLYRYWCVSRVPCNWLQGLEGSVDSVHAAMLHQTWIALSVDMEEHANLSYALAQAAPTYETEFTSYGLRAAALRKTADGRTYVRVTEHMMPLVTITPVGEHRTASRARCSSSRRSTTPTICSSSEPWDRRRTARCRSTRSRCRTRTTRPTPPTTPGLRGDRWNAWGQDRALMDAGHFTGFGRSLLEEDVVIQTSMGPILDRTKENLSSSDVAVAHLRRMLLDAVRGLRRGHAAARQRVGARRRPTPERLRDARRRGPALGGRRARSADHLR